MSDSPTAGSLNDEKKKEQTRCHFDYPEEATDKQAAVSSANGGKDLRRVCEISMLD